MTKSLIQRNLRLGHEFDTYVAQHRGPLKLLSNRVHVVLTSSDDLELSDANRQIVKSKKIHRLVEAHKKGKKWTLTRLRG